jgi:hypothetical protein
MRLVMDCDSCGGPMPAGRACPHCEAKPKGSLRGFAVRAALFGLMACSPVMVEYGLACTNDNCDEPFSACADHSVGEVCMCSGTQICACTDAGVCEPYEPRDGG